MYSAEKLFFFLIYLEKKKGLRSSKEKGIFFLNFRLNEGR